MAMFSILLKKYKQHHQNILSAQPAPQSFCQLFSEKLAVC